MLACVQRASRAQLNQRFSRSAMKKIIALRVLDDYQVWLSFGDGVEGTVDFSQRVGKGVFAPWVDYTFFRQAAVGEGGRTLTWPGELDFCADALWLQVTGRPPADLFPKLRQRRPVYAHP
jgi:hypothetical protein